RGGSEVVNAVGTGDLPFQRRGDKALDQVGIGTHVYGGHGDHGILQLRILTHVEFERRAQAQQQDHQADHRGQYRLANKNLGKVHTRPQLLSGRGLVSADGVTSLLMITVASLRSFSRPLVAMRSPGSRPSVTATRSPRSLPVLTKRRLTISVSGSSSFSITT